MLCVSCKIKAGNTDHFATKDNELILRLGGRMQIQHGAALFNFIKDGVAQKAIHQLKYGGRSDVAKVFGRQFGRKLLSSKHFEKTDFILPIPVHYKRRAKRGFNQSEVFGGAIASTINAPMITDMLVKRRTMKSLTSKNRVERFHEVLNSFEIRGGIRALNKTVLIVDDVLTTGATIEATYQLLSEIPDIKIQIAIIGLAND